ncbi:UTRA domain-containing protein [Chelativorans sp. ZYF759]|uniref:GntR family transcriptional regulator n=1 Tax=Chelativorans sp. ZYF759 TaxID=2692213 RepID=UPI00145ECA41|nr:GntR family transcriptional regulator [Chelativorans sp. ZYF759]NMG40679.1 UTRA domain-containing protein [Chelativorans sp. ZYF759]
MDDAPLYLRIASDLESEITSGALKAGEKIESERVLSERMGVSRMTARQALRHLSAKGLVETRTGQGTFVGSRQIEQRLETLSGFTEEMDRQGRHASSVIVTSGTRQPDEDCARALSLPATGKVHSLTRVRFVDGAPVALETTDVVASRTQGLLELADFQSASLYATLSAHFGIVPTRAEQTLMAGLADAAIARTLHTEQGAPVLNLTRLTRDQDGNAFEYVRSTYRGDFFVMKVNLSLGAGTQA